MPTLKQGVDSVIRIARNGGVPSDDEKISERFLRYTFNKHRADLICNKFAFQDNKISPTIDTAWIQDLGCIKLQEVDLVECGNAPKWGCTVKKTVDKIPDYIDIPNYGGRLFYFGDISGRNNYDFTLSNQAGFTGSLRFSGVINRYYIKNGFGYVITNNTDLCWVNVQHIFSNPEEAFVGTQVAGVCAFDWKKDNYPVSSDMMAYLEEEILLKELGMILQTPSDETNNSVSDVQQVMAHGR